LIGHQAPHYIPKPSHIKRDLRDGKRGIIDGIKWAQNDRAMADVEIVLKRGPGLPLIDQMDAEEECRRFDEIIAEDEELATYIDESERQVGSRIWIDGEAYYEISTVRWDGFLVGAQLVFDRWSGKPLLGPSRYRPEGNICRVLEMARPSGGFQSKEVKVKAAGMPWYKCQEDYLRVLEIMEDTGATFVPATYDAFLREERELKARGVFVFRCLIDREHFLSWCRREVLRPCYLSSLKYANVFAYNIVHVSSVRQLEQIAA
jgi:hypothetical protein